MRTPKSVTFLIPPVVLIAMCFALAGPPSTVPPEGIRSSTPQTHAFVNARIVPAPGKVIEKGSLVIRDGVIVSIGAEVQAPADARVWDLAGKTIYAGLIDAYSELSVGASPEESGSRPGGGARGELARSEPSAGTGAGANYWNAPITPQFRVDRAYKPDAEVNKKHRSQGFVARLVAPSRGLLKGTSALVTTGDADATQSILKPQMAQHASLTVARSFDESRGYPSSPMGAYALVRQAIYDSLWYRDAQAAWQKDLSLPRPEQNDALQILQQQLADNTLFIIDASDENYDLRVARIADEFKLNAAIRGGGQEYRRVDAIAAMGRAVIVPLNFPKAPNVSSPEQALAVSLEDLMDWDLAPENAARLDKAGVKISLCTQGLRDKGTFLAAMRRAVVRGLSNDAALRAMTTAPAELFGVSSRLGTLEAGKSASFFVTDGDLFAEKTKVLETWVDGRRYEVVSQPIFNVRGSWKATLQTGDDRRDATVTITGDLEKPAGKIRFDGDLPQTNPTTQPATQPSREVDLVSVNLRGARLTFNFKSDSMSRNGIAQLSATVSTDQKPGDSWLGSGVWPDGTGFVVTATKTDAAPTTQPDADDETVRTADAGEVRGRRGRAGATSKPVIKDALFAVNYPLGEFGRGKLPEAQDVLFTNATVWTSGPQGVIEHGYVFVQNGKITKVGGDDWYKTALMPPTTLVVDCQGKHISAGIIDCHSHIATDGGINESGQAVTAEVRIGDFIDPTDINIYRQLGGGVTTANVLHGSANPIGGQNQVIKLRWGALPEEMKFAGAPPGIKFALGENVKQSNWDIPDDKRTRYPQSRMGVQQIVWDEFRAAQDYKRRWEEWNATKTGIPPRRDLELDAIVEILDGKRWIHCHSYRQDEILALIRTCDAFGVKIGTFQHILEGYKVADAMAKHGAMGSSFSDWWAYKFEVYDAIPYNGALMRQAGVVVSYNSDDAELARRLNLEAAKAVKYGGVPPDEALKFVTLNPAKQLRIDERIGSIEPGKDADLVLWSESPLSNYTRCEQTWIDGRKYFDRVDDAKARGEVAKMRVALVQRILTSGEAMAEPGDNEDRARVLWPNEDTFCDHGGEHR